MTLKFVGIDRSKGGIGYKVVRKNPTTKDLYQPYFSYFLKSGFGGYLPPTEGIQPYMKDRIFITNTFYALGEASRVRHKRFAHAFNDEIYHAGIHLWVELDYARERFFALRALDDSPRSLVILKCRWTGLIACDSTTIVVSRVIPINEVNLQEVGDGGFGWLDNSKEPGD